MNETRIELTDTAQDMLFKMSDGNPGAITTMVELLQCNASIDPESAFGNIGAIITLDSLNIYGTDIYVLWSDICNKDTTKMIAVLRASQLGLLPSVTLKDACSRQDYSGKEMIDVEDMYKQVCDQLDSFDKDN